MKTSRSITVFVAATYLLAGVPSILPTWAGDIVPALDGTGSQVTPIENTFTITGGATSGDGQTLFHSFTDFTVLSGEQATFLSSPAIQNILSRVTGGNASFIDGLLQVSGSGANLVFLNPNGILFGPNAALNLQGGFAALTADQVLFDTGVFGTVGTPDYTALVGTPTHFSFPATPASVVNTGELRVLPGETVVLAGGQVLNTGTIAAPGGEVVISAVAGGDRVQIAQTGQLLSLELEMAAPSPATLPLLPFSPTDLPGLLTGYAAAAATDVVVQPDGTVSLTSGTPVAVGTGNVAIAGLLDVSGTVGGQVSLFGETIALPEGLIDISGLLEGGNLAVYASTQLGLGISLNTGPGGRVLIDPPTLTVDEALAEMIAGTLAEGADFDLAASELITVDAAIDTSDQESSATLRFLDEDLLDEEGSNELSLAIALNAPITLAADQTLTGEGSLIALSSTGSLQNAVDLAADGAIVNLAAGTFAEAREIRLTRDITLAGVGADSTVLDGNDDHRVLQINEDVVVMLRDLAIANGNVPNLGGGIFNLGTLTIENSTIRDNTAGTIGGGIANIEGTLTVHNSTIRGNLGTTYGGGFLNTGELAIYDSLITENTARSSGGGIVNSTDGRLTVERTIISGNLAGTNADAGYQNGGGVDNAGGTAVLRDSVISDNRAEGNGGGILNVDGELTLIDSTLRGNSAGLEGGGIRNRRDSELTVRGSTLSNNESLRGGGISNAGLVVEIADSTLVDNVAVEAGGGIHNSTVIDSAEAELTLRNSTVSGNQAETGGGIFNSDAVAEAELTLISSLVSGNFAETDANITNFGDFDSGGNNLFGSNNDSGVSGVDFADTDVVPIVPLSRILDRILANNGGTTQTLALVEGSPAINMGSGTGPDQRGVPVFNNVRDIGAFEFEGESLPVTTVDPCLAECGSETPDNADPAAILDDLEDSTARPAARRPAQDLDSLAANEAVTGEIPVSEAVFTPEYETYLGVEADPVIDFDVLKRAAETLGIPPVLVYASFVPAAPSRASLTVAELDKAFEQELIAGINGEVTDDTGEQWAQQQGLEAEDDILQITLVLPEGRPQRFRPGVTRGEVLATVRQLRQAINNPILRRRGSQAYLTPAQNLYSWLVAPVEAGLSEAGAGHISFILDRGLRSLPLATLHDGKQFIIERYSVGLMPSLSLTDTRIASVKNASVLAMGASEFETQLPLPAVPVELDVINRLWPGEVHLNEPFVPTTLLKARQQTPYTVLHMATHAEFRAGALDESYIQFWDRRLSLDQLPELQLGAPTVELLVLSACNTALGSEEAELGFAGLAVQSGAKSAIATLWQISDLETAGLMAELYTQLDQASYKAEALRQAQLAMLRGGVTVQNGQLTWSGGTQALPASLNQTSLADTQHPYYWSGFTLVGSPW